MPPALDTLATWAKTGVLGSGPAVRSETGNMRNFWISASSLGIVCLAFAGCSSETIVVRGGPAEETEETSPAADDASAAPALPAAPDASTYDPCACPSHCRSASGAAVCTPALAPNELSERETIGDFIVSSYEFWPHAAGDPVPPEKVGYGYAAGSGPARACAAEARKVLVEILKTRPPSSLARLREKHGVRAFFQQNHDMTGAPEGRKAPTAQSGLWLYDARLVKWVSHTERDGRCRLPNARDLDDFAKRCEETFPRCDAAP